MMDFNLTTCLRFLIKLKMASQALKLPEMNLSQFCTLLFLGIISTVCKSGTEVPCLGPVSKNVLGV